jgi:hypothetical protein
MQITNLMEAIQARERVQEQNDELWKKHRAIEVLRGIDDCVSNFLAKRLGQGHATAVWEVIHPQCFRLTISYRGQTWSLRVPVP